MNSLTKLLLIAALALFASAAQADHSVRLQGGLWIQQDGYEIYLGAPLHRYDGYTYRTPRFIAPHHRKHKRFSRDHRRIRAPLVHDYRRYRHQRQYNYRPHRSERHFNRQHRSEGRHFNRQHRGDRSQRRQH